MTFKGILFDLDGTLLDTNELILQSFQHTMRTHYNKDADLTLAKSYFGKPLRDALQEMGPGQVDDLIKTYREFNLLHHDELAKVFTGVVVAVQKLYSAGIQLAIVTSKTRTTAIRGLKLFDMDKYFPVVIGHEDCKCHKPNPEPVLHALEKLNLPAVECLMVGDSPFDLISARAAGVKTAAVRWTEVPWQSLLDEKPDYILETMNDLLTVCEVHA